MSGEHRTSVSLRYALSRPECACGWAGSYWISNAQAVAEANTHAEPQRVREARIQVPVAPVVLLDAPMLDAVKADRERELAAMFSLTVTEPAWSEPEPMWMSDEEEPHLVPRHLAGNLADGPPAIYFLTASQRGVPVEVQS